MAIMAIGPFATDTYLAGLPQLQRSLQTSATVAQLTLTAFIVGMAVGQLILGPVSDAHGRRRILVTGTVLFLASSLLCAVAPTGLLLVLARLVEGVAAGTGLTIGRAIVTDTYRGDHAATMFGTIASVTFLGPIIAPAIGGVVLTYHNWRVIFFGLAVLGLVMSISAIVGVPETLPPDQRQPSGWGMLARRMGDLLTDWGFLRHVVVQCLATAGFFTYIGGSSFVLQETFHITSSTYTWVFSTNAVGMAVTSYTFRRIVLRVGALRLRAIGLVTSTIAAAALLAVALVDPQARAPLALPWSLLWVVVACMGLTIPSTTALAQEAGRRSAGTASALQGGLVFLTGAVATPLTGLIGYDTLLPMALLMTVFFVAATILMILTTSSLSAPLRENS
ncbi:MAG: transporter, family, multidrug resistance protein [Actinomycetota bacterium]|nr:transporter, family, multidrug resistance protein [Actinomycetota bacterium]